MNQTKIIDFFDYQMTDETRIIRFDDNDNIDWNKTFDNEEKPDNERR